MAITRRRRQYLCCRHRTGTVVRIHRHCSASGGGVTCYTGSEKVQLLFTLQTVKTTTSSTVTIETEHIDTIDTLATQ